MQRPNHTNLAPNYSQGYNYSILMKVIYTATHQSRPFHLVHWDHSHKRNASFPRGVFLAKAGGETSVFLMNSEDYHEIYCRNPHLFLRWSLIIAGVGGIPHRQAAPPKKQKTNLLTRLLSISSVPYTAYVPEPATFLHAISAEAKQIWIIGVLAIMSRASTPMRLALVAVVAAITMISLPPRLWRPQLLRLGGLCAFIFCFTAFGSDAVPPVLSTRAPTAAALGSTAVSGAEALPASISDVIGQSYSYVVLNLGPFSVTKRSLSLGITIAGLTFVALQCASLCLVTTPPERMALAVGRALRPLGLLGVPVKELVLTVLLSLRFMATVFEEARNLCLGLASRGIDWALLGGKGTLALAVGTAGRLFSNLLARSDNIATAMAARGFRGPEDHVLHLAEEEEAPGKRILADVGAAASLAGLVALSRVLV